MTSNALAVPDQQTDAAPGWLGLDPDMSTLDIALRCADRGLSVFPVDSPDLARCVGVGKDHDPATCTDRGKHPAVAFTMAATTNPKMVATWFTGATKNIGIYVGGSDLLVVDEDQLGAFTGRAAERNYEIPSTFTVSTGKGRHFYFRADPDRPIGQRSPIPGAIDIRSGNGYVVGPGSRHRTGAIYTVTNDVEPAAAPGWLLDELEALAAPKPDPAAQQDDGWETVAISTPRGLDALPDVIRGPRVDSGGERHNTLWSYACSLRARSAPMSEAEHLFRVAWERCEQPPDCTTPMTWDEALAELRDAYSSHPEGMSAEYLDADFKGRDGDAEVRQSWQQVDLTLVLAGDYEAPEPTVGRRADGAGLFYPGKVHSVAGETESAKTWLALSAALDELNAGHHVVFIDFEDDEGGVVGRLLTLGCRRDVIAERLHYLRPEDPLSGSHRTDLINLLHDCQPSFVTIDGVAEALAMHGLDPNDNADVARFGRKLPRMIAAAGPAVVALDHVSKSTEGRGKYAIGAVHKLNGIDGAAFTLETRAPFGIGLTGRSVIRIAKDRPGRLRRRAQASRSGDLFTYGGLVLTSRDEDFAEIEITKPENWETPDFRPTYVMGQIMELIENDRDKALSKRVIRAGVTSKHETVDKAIDLLILDGYLSKNTPYRKLKDWTDA